MGSAYYDDGDAGPAPRQDAYGYDDYGADGSISIGPFLRNMFSLVRRNVWLITAIVATFLVAAAVLTILTTPKYTAQASIEISSQAQQVLGEEFDQATDDVEGWDVDRFLNTQISILTSRALADRVAQKLNLYSEARFFNAVQINPDDYDTSAGLRNAVINSLMTNLAVSLPVSSRIAELSFTSTDRQMSATIANTYANEFIQSNLQRKFDSSSYARDFVEDQLLEARARLEDSEQGLNVYARQASLIRTRDPSNTTSTTTSNSITTASLLQVNQSANLAQATRVAAEARWNAERGQPLLSSPAALASPVVQRLQTRKSEVEAELENARQRYLGDHPAIQRLEADLANVDAQLTQAANQAREAVRADYVAARAAEQSLQAQVGQLEGATLEEQDRSVRYNTLAREADTNRSIYEGLLQRYRELNASAGITASNVSIIDVAEPPVSPSSPNPILNLAVALFLGLMTAGLVVFLKDQLDDRIRIPEEVEQKVGLSLLGVIPETRAEDPVAELRDPKSALAEGYSSLRSSLLYSTREGLPHVILVTSAQAAEGKSTTSYAIARNMALIGKKSLLIDADLRRPSIQRLAGVANSVGLSDMLVGEKTAAEAIVRGELDNLYLLPSGPLPPSPAELLSSTRLPALLQALRREFDVVVIDSAPVLGLADSPGLSALADGVLMVIESNRGRGGQLKTAVRRLRMMKPTILGAVLTKFDPTAAGNSYSTYYQYDYYTYRSESAE
jgi:capsular exopolysaccharide synthesis family protein